MCADAFDNLLDDDDYGVLPGKVLQCSYNCETSSKSALNKYINYETLINKDSNSVNESKELDMLRDEEDEDDEELFGVPHFDRPDDYDPEFYINLYNYPKDWTENCHKYEFPFEKAHWDANNFSLIGDDHDYICSWNIDEGSYELSLSKLSYCISKGEEKILDKKSGFAWVRYDDEKSSKVRFVEGTVENKELQELNDQLGDLILFSPRFRHLMEMDNYYNDDDVSGCSLCKLLYGKHTFEVKGSSKLPDQISDDEAWICENCPCMLRCRNNNIVKNYAR